MAILACAALLAAGSTPANQETAASPRAVPLTVLDRDGFPVSGLTSERVRAKFNGKAVRAAGLRESSTAPKVGIVLDLSARRANAANPAVKDAVDAARLLVRGLGAKHSITLVTAGESPQRIGPSPPGNDEVASYLNNVKPVESSRTALFDATAEAIRALAPAGFADSLVVVTDGDDNASRLKSSDVEELARKSGIRVFSILLFSMPSGAGQAASLDRGQQLLRSLAEESGGAAIAQKARSSEGSEIGALLRPLFWQISVVYRLELELPGGANAAGDLKLEILDEQGRKLKAEQALYPRRLFRAK